MCVLLIFVLVVVVWREILGSRAVNPPHHLVAEENQKAPRAFFDDKERKGIAESLRLR